MKGCYQCLEDKSTDFSANIKQFIDIIFCESDRTLLYTLIIKIKIMIKMMKT